MAILREDFQDEILAESMNGRRRFQIIQNDDGTVSFKDVTELNTVGDDYGQKEINQLNKEVNKSIKKDELITSLEITEAGKVMDGKTCSEYLLEALEKVNNSIKKDELITSLAITEAGRVMDGKVCSEYILKALGTTLEATLTAGSTTLTFTSSAITDACMIDVYTDSYGVNPSNSNQNGNTLTLTFDAQSKSVNVKVKVM